MYGSITIKRAEIRALYAWRVIVGNVPAEAPTISAAYDSPMSKSQKFMIRVAPYAQPAAALPVSRGAHCSTETQFVLYEMRGLKRPRRPSYPVHSYFCLVKDFKRAYTIGPSGTRSARLLIVLT